MLVHFGFGSVVPAAASVNFLVVVLQQRGELCTFSALRDIFGFPFEGCAYAAAFNAA